jgi:hypothetical protein
MDGLSENEAPSAQLPKAHSTRQFVQWLTNGTMWMHECLSWKTHIPVGTHTAMRVLLCMPHGGEAVICDPEGLAPMTGHALCRAMPCRNYQIRF